MPPLVMVGGDRRLCIRRQPQADAAVGALEPRPAFAETAAMSTSTPPLVVLALNVPAMS